MRAASLALTSVTLMTAGENGVFVGPGLGRDSATSAEAARINSAIKATAPKIGRAIPSRTAVGGFDVRNSENAL